MRYMSTLIAVSDMERSKQFYKNVLGLEVIADFGANVTLEGGVAMQTIESWEGFIEGREVVLGSNSGELYFEESDMDSFAAHLESLNLEYVHRLKEHSWGQRVVRFYDPDHHIIEVGEDMVMVVKRFAAKGMTEPQIAERMDVPLEYVKEALSKAAEVGL